MDDIPKDYLLDFFGAYSSPSNGFLHTGCPQSSGRNVLQTAAILANGGAYAANYNHLTFTHNSAPCPVYRIEKALGLLRISGAVFVVLSSGMQRRAP
jgi:hypothetical protein